MLLDNEKKNRENTLSVLEILRSVFLLLIGAALVGCLVFMVSRFQETGRAEAYMVASSAEAASEQEVQTGLMGVVNGVSDMKRFSDATRVVKVPDAEENVLAGVSGVDRRLIRKSFFQQSFSTAGQIGYLAEQMVLDNQLMSSSDYWTLVRIVEAETTGGDVMSKMMVAGVVLNRVNDDNFPDTIYDVVFQGSQFTPTRDGRFYSCTISDDSVEAVDRVLAGEDYSQGALYFVARSSADPSKLSWFDSSLTWLCYYGGHDFYI